jgi:hypothetical protein
MLTPLSQNLNGMSRAMERKPKQRIRLKGRSKNMRTFPGVRREESGVDFGNTGYEVVSGIA